jgi:hypothetical protein
MDWIWSSRCLALFCTFTQSIHLKWVSGEGINSPRHPKSRWLKAAESSTIGWFDAMFFRASDHQVLLAAALHCTWPLTQFIWRFIQRTVSSSGAEDLAAKTSLLASSRPSDRPTLPLAMPSVHPVLLNLSWRVSILIQTEHRIDRRSNQLDRRFIRCYCLLLLCFFQSSDICRNWTIGSSDGASSLEPSRGVPSTLTHTLTLVPRYRRFIWRCFFFFFASSTCHCFNLTYSTYHHLLNMPSLSLKIYTPVLTIRTRRTIDTNLLSAVENPDTECSRMGTKSLCSGVDEERVDAPNRDGVQLRQRIVAHQKELCSLKKTGESKSTLKMQSDEIKRLQKLTKDSEDLLRLLLSSKRWRG